MFMHIPPVILSLIKKAYRHFSPAPGLDPPAILVFSKKPQCLNGNLLQCFAYPFDNSIILFFFKMKSKKRQDYKKYYFLFCSILPVFF